jgi:hypothetical protein
MLKAPGHSFSSPRRYYFFPLQYLPIQPIFTHTTSTNHHHCCAVVDGSNTMTTTPRSGNDAMLLADDDMLPTPLGSRSVKAATTTLRLVGDDHIISEDATLFRTLMPSVTTTPCRLLMTPCRRLLTTTTPHSTTSRAKTTPRSAMTQCSSTTGFDLLSGKIRAVHRAINPGIFLSDSDNLERIAVNAATAVGRKVKSLFTEGLGKQKIVKVDRALLSAFSTAATQRRTTSSASTTPTLTSAKRHNTGATVTPVTILPVCALSRVSTTPDPESNVSTNASATPVATPTLHTLLFSDAESMLINQDIVPGHFPHRTSVLQLVYKRLPPEDIVQLRANDELMLSPQLLPKRQTKMSCSFFASIICFSRE